MESHVDVEVPDESICKEQAPPILQLVVQPFVVIVEECQLLLRRPRSYAVDDRPNFAFVPVLSGSRLKQVHMQGVQYQAGLSDCEHCLIAAPTSHAGHRRLEVENSNVE